MIGTSQLINAFGAPVCFTDTTDIFKDGSGVALYSLDYDGTAASGGSFGKFGGAAIFNGSSSKIQLPNDLVNAVSAQTFSVSFWFRNDNLTAYGNPFSAYAWSGGVNYGWSIYAGYGNSKLRFLSYSSNGNIDVSGTTTLVQGTWYHAVVTYTGGTIVMYLNGSQEYSGSPSSGDRTYITNHTYYIGAANNGAGGTEGYFTGIIDDVRVYTDVLTSTEVGHIYNNTTASIPTSNLLAYYKLNGNANDETSNYNNGTSTNVTYKLDGSPVSVDFGVEGKINYGAKFNGSSSIMTITDGGTGTGGPARVPLTVSLWVKTTASNQSGIINDYGSTYAFYIQMESSSTGGAGKLSVASNYSGGFIGTSAGTAAINDGNWHHLVLVNNTSDNTQKLYIDGNTTPAISHALSTGTKTANPIAVGYYVGHIGTYNFDGSIAQIRLFKAALTTTQIGKLFAETACEYTATTTDNNYPVANSVYYKLDNNSKSELASTHYLFIGDAGNLSSSGRLNSVDADFTYTRPTGYSEWGGSWDTSNKTGSATQTFEESDKKWTKSGSYYNAVWSTNKYNSGKYYAEIEFLGTELIYGISRLTSATGYGTTLQNDSVYYGSWATHSWKYSTTNTAEGAILSTNDVIGLAADFDNQILQVYRNNVLLDTVSIARPDGTETDIEYRFGRFGQAAVFNGSSSKIDTGISSLSSPFSVSMWINEDSLNSGHFFSNWNSTSADMYWETTSDGRLRISLDGYSQDFFGTAGDVKINTWHHIAVALGSGSYEVYLDGNSLGTSTTSVTTFSSGQNFMIGNSSKPSTPLPFDGLIDQVRIYSTALTGSQVTELYNEKPETDTSNFKAVLYEGTSADRYVSNVGLEPDLVWLKNRDQADGHRLYDTVRGVTNTLFPHLPNAQYSSSGDGISTMDANGFFLDNGANFDGYNKSGESYVAWTWKGSNADAVSNSDGTLTSSVSANTAAGFSIVKYTGNGTAGATVGHGLSSKPQFILFKNLDTAVSWIAYDTINNVIGYLDNTDSLTDGRRAWAVNNTDPTSTLVTLGNNQATNASSDFIMYCWHSVAGYSSIGTYTGNDSTTGPSVNVGFRPSWVMIKKTSNTGGWYIFDAARAGSTTAFPKMLYANIANVEYDTTGTAYNGQHITTTATTFEVDFSSAWTDLNELNSTYLYMAFK